MNKTQIPMITKEQQVIVSLSREEIAEWSQAIWQEQWAEYISECQEIAYEMGITLPQAIMRLPFIEWYDLEMARIALSVEIYKKPKY